MNPYTATDQRIHYLCQVISKANRTYVPKKEDDSHTNLYFDNVANRITGRWITAKNNKVLFTLNLDRYAFEILDPSHKVLAEVSVVSKTREAIEKEIEKLLPSLGLNPDGFIDELHYEISVYDFIDEAYGELNETGLDTWTEYRALANDACFEMLGYAQAWEEVRIWPHHFDTGIYFKPKEKLGIGFGLAMEEEMAGAPYFYFSAYPEEGTINYDNTPKGHWRWETGDWKGGILSLEDLEKLPAAKRKDAITQFYVAGLKWVLAQ